MLQNAAFLTVSGALLGAGAAVILGRQVSKRRAQMAVRIWLDTFSREWKEQSGWSDWTREILDPVRRMLEILTPEKMPEEYRDGWAQLRDAFFKLAKIEGVFTWHSDVMPDASSLVHSHVDLLGPVGPKLMRLIHLERKLSRISQLIEASIGQFSGQLEDLRKSAGQLERAVMQIELATIYFQRVPKLLDELRRQTNDWPRAD